MNDFGLDHFAVRRALNLDDHALGGLAEVLVDCVAGGASVGFMAPFGRDDALAFWRGIALAVERGERALLLAEDARGRIVGTVQLGLAMPPNQPHRADLMKMLVHRAARRAGVGAALMRAAESTAVACGKSLLVLDTASADAERLYTRLGWQDVGVIPDFALLPGGGYCATRLYYRRLDGSR